MPTTNNYHKSVIGSTAVYGKYMFRKDQALQIRTQHRNTPKWGPNNLINGRHSLKID